MLTLVTLPNLQTVHARLEASNELKVGSLNRMYRSLIRSELTSVDSDIMRQYRKRRVAALERGLESGGMALLMGAMSQVCGNEGYGPIKGYWGKQRVLGKAKGIGESKGYWGKQRVLGKAKGIGASKGYWV